MKTNGNLHGVNGAGPDLPVVHMVSRYWCFIGLFVKTDTKEITLAQKY